MYQNNHSGPQEKMIADHYLPTANNDLSTLRECALQKFGGKNQELKHFLMLSLITEEADENQNWLSLMHHSLRIKPILFCPQPLAWHFNPIQTGFFLGGSSGTPGG